HREREEDQRGLRGRQQRVALTRSMVRSTLHPLVVGAWLACAASIGAPVLSWAQPPAAPASGGQDAHDQPPGPPPTADYPAFHLSGFADIDFAAQDRSEGSRGFSEGQFVLHLAAALSPRVNFFGELSFTPRADAGAGTPPATGFNAEVERVIIRFDQSD